MSAAAASCQLCAADMGRCLCADLLPAPVVCRQMVVVFYVAIILVLIGANLYRRRHTHCTDRRPLLVYDQRSAGVDQRLLTCEQEPSGDCV